MQLATKRAGIKMLRSLSQVFPEAVVMCSLTVKTFRQLCNVSCWKIYANSQTESMLKSRANWFKPRKVKSTMLLFEKHRENDNGTVAASENNYLAGFCFN